MRRMILAFASLPILAACATPPGSSPPPAATVQAPTAWRASAAVETETSVTEVWRSFGDEHLADLIAVALANNTDLAIAEARVREAEALRQQAQSALAPSINLSLGAQKSRELSPFGTPRTTTVAQPQIQVAYEADLWGRIREADRAARASLQANIYARDAARLSIAGAVARAYVTLLSLDAQRATAEAALASRREAAARADHRARVGQTTDLERQQAVAELEAAAQRAPALALAISRQETALNILLGRNSGPVARGELAALTVPTPGAPLPSTLLRRRPDLAQAEATLAASDASLASARAAFLPQVRLSATAGELFVRHLDPLTVWSVGGSVLAPLFDAGRLRAQADGAAARRDQAAFAYRKAALTAFGEVESALEGLDQLAAQEVATQRQRDANAKALAHAQRRFEAGYAAYLEPLDAQRGLFAADLTVTQVREARLLNVIALYQALGGGWRMGGEPVGDD